MLPMIKKGNKKQLGAYICSM